MLWRVRTTLPDRPGALAALAEECGRADADIRALRVFPGADGADAAVTDELVLDVPDHLGADDVAALLARAGGAAVSVLAADEQCLQDQPTRYVEAARRILAAPASFPEVAARLFDADVVPAQDHVDVLELAVLGVAVQLRRAVPFTAVERARGEAMAALVTDALGRAADPAPTAAVRDGHGPPRLSVTEAGVAALVGGVVVGRAELRHDEPGSLLLELHVDPAWRRRGTATRLLAEAAREAARRGASDLVVSTAADNRAVLPLTLAAGLRGRIRMSGDRLTVRIGVAALRPRATG